MSRNCMIYAFVVATLSGCSREPQELLSSYAAENCVEQHYRQYEDQCDGHAVSIIAFVVDKNGNEVIADLQDPQSVSPYLDEDVEFIVEVKDRSWVNLRAGDKIQINGVFDGDTFLGGHTVITANTLVELELSEGEQESRNRRVAVESALRQERSRISSEAIQGDIELAAYARNRREELIEESIDYTSSTAHGITIDSFEMADGSVVMCRLTRPGPAYSCGE